MNLDNIKLAIESAGGTFCKATQEEYEKALNSLTTEWKSYSDLPCDFHYYITLQEHAGVERLVEPLYAAGEQPRGFRNYFRLAA